MVTALPLLKQNIYFVWIHLKRASSAIRFKALETIRQGIRKHFGAFRAQVAKGLESAA